MSGHFLDLERWPRRAHFEFFRRYEQPFFNICAEVPVTRTLQRCRAEGHSFALASWFACQQTLDALAPFRYRLRGDQVWIHDRVRIAMTVLDPDETFRFCHLPWADTFPEFARGARSAMQQAQPTAMDDRPDDDAVVHGSTLPWVRFTGAMHPRRAVPDDSIPKIVFGKYGPSSDGVGMPVSVEAHHALMDGLHASRFFMQLSERLTDPKWLDG